MKRPHPRIVAWLCVLLASILGCGSPAPGPVAAPSTESKTVKLPDLDQPLGPLDGNRVNVPPPKGWQVAPRSSSCLVRFKASPTLSYPTILVTAEDYQEMAAVSGDNVGEFAKQVASTMDDDPAKLAVDVTPTTVGRRSYVTYRRLAKVKQAVLERMFLDTVVAGRKYQFELRTLKGTLGKFEPYLLAVAGGTEYLADSAPATQPVVPVATAESPAPAETPVEATGKTPDTAGKAASATTGQTAAAAKPAEAAPKEAIEAAQPEPPAAQPKPAAAQTKPAAAQTKPAAAQPKPPAAQTPKKEPVKKEPPKEKPKKATEFELEDELK